MASFVRAGLTQFLHSDVLLFNFTFNIVGIVPNVWAEADEPYKENVKSFTFSSKI